MIEARDSWVLKGRFGCGGSSVIVGAHPSWPTQRLPAVEIDADGRTHVRAACDRQHRAATPASRSTLDFEGRITTESWAALWPHLVRFAARSPGYYIAQSCVEPEPFDAMIYDGRQASTNSRPRPISRPPTRSAGATASRACEPSGALCRAVPRGHPHTNITTRGALLPVMSEDEFDRLYLALELDQQALPVKRPATAPQETVPGRAGVGTPGRPRTVRAPRPEGAACGRDTRAEGTTRDRDVP